MVVTDTRRPYSTGNPLASMTSVLSGLAEVASQPVKQERASRAAPSTSNHAFMGDDEKSTAILKDIVEKNPDMKDIIKDEIAFKKMIKDGRLKSFI